MLCLSVCNFFRVKKVTNYICHVPVFWKISVKLLFQTLLSVNVVVFFHKIIHVMCEKLFLKYAAEKF